jgi:hypothetical protein
MDFILQNLFLLFSLLGIIIFDSIHFIIEKLTPRILGKITEKKIPL